MRRRQVRKLWAIERRCDGKPEYLATVSSMSLDWHPHCPVPGLVFREMLFATRAAARGAQAVLAEKFRGTRFTFRVLRVRETVEIL